jgi:lysyl-tRNA synthetase class I
MTESEMKKITSNPFMIDYNTNSVPHLESLGNFMTPEPEKPNSKKCIFAIGAKVSVSDVNLRLKNPFRDEYVKFRAGRISNIYPLSEYTNPPFKCLYEISFNDGTVAVEVPEEVIRKSISIDTSKSEGSKTDSETQTDSSLKPRQANNSNYFMPSSPQSNNSNYFMPQNNKTDLLTAIALNNLSESIRDATYSPRMPNVFLESPYKYETTDVGENENLQKDVTDFFYNKTQKWLKEDHEFSKVKKHLKFIKSKKGNPYIYKLLKLFVKKNNVNWYELRGEDHYDDVKEYIRNKLASI